MIVNLLQTFRKIMLSPSSR